MRDRQSESVTGTALKRGAVRDLSTAFAFLISFKMTEEHAQSKNFTTSQDDKNQGLCWERSTAVMRCSVAAGAERSGEYDDLWNGTLLTHGTQTLFRTGRQHVMSGR